MVTLRTKVLITNDVAVFAAFWTSWSINRWIFRTVVLRIVSRTKVTSVMVLSVVVLIMTLFASELNTIVIEPVLLHAVVSATFEHRHVVVTGEEFFTNGLVSKEHSTFSLFTLVSSILHMFTTSMGHCHGWIVTDTSHIWTIGRTRSLMGTFMTLTAFEAVFGSVIAVFSPFLVGTDSTLTSHLPALSDQEVMSGHAVLLGTFLTRNDESKFSIVFHLFSPAVVSTKLITSVVPSGMVLMSTEA
jgi:hypothetical protein